MLAASIAVDHSSSVPPFEQVRLQLAAQITDGRLPVGTRLPPVRTLAVDLGLAANTVARVYRELEAAGLVETRGRAGTAVAAGADEVGNRLYAAAQQYATVAHALGADPEQALRAVRTVLSSE
jgi:DNA-binding transcriptional regulator YhcF (GntR family)